MISVARQRALKGNHLRMFFIRALLNIRMFNVVLSLFYLARGLTLPEIFYANLFWAAGVLLFEIPSSYLADRWGRKKTLFLGAVFALTQWLIFFFGFGFFWMALGALFHGLFYAAFSGTDQALVYDTDKELGQEKDALHSLGRYESAQSVFKIVAPIIAALVAQDLAEWQFQALVGVDIIASVLAALAILHLVEPDHTMDVHKMERGLIRDGWQLFRRHPYLFRVIFNKEALFFAALVLVLSYQAYFVDLGLPIVVLGLAYSAHSLVVFVWNWYLGQWAHARNATRYVDRLNVLFTAVAGVLVVSVYGALWPLFLLVLLQVLLFLHSARTPFFQQIFHERFSSFNRATTVSLANIVHNVLQFPIFIATGWLIGVDVRTPFIITFVCGLSVLLCFYLSTNKNNRVFSSFFSQT